MCATASRTFVILCAVVVSSTAHAQTDDDAPQSENTTIVPAEEPSPPSNAEIPPPAEPPPAAPDRPVVQPTAASKPAVTSRLDTSLYGIIELDALHDSTRSFDEGMGAGRVAKPGTVAGDNGRTIFTARNSRFGFKISAPEINAMKLSGQIEVDFAQQPSANESTYYTQGLLRLRQANLKLESAIVDVLVGQTAHLFGWQSCYSPATLSSMPLAGTAFGRTPQLRLTKTLKAEMVSLDIAAAALRPPQRDAKMPEVQAGARLQLASWKGIRTLGATSTGAYPLGLAVSVTQRQFEVTFANAPTAPQTATGRAMSLDALVPVVPVHDANNRGNALSLTGTLVMGSGYGDLLGGLMGTNDRANLNPTTPEPMDTPDVGVVMYDVAGNLHTVNWQGFVVGAEYYLPPTGIVFVSASYSQVESDNVADFAAVDKVGTIFHRMVHYDGNLFVDATSELRLGLSYQHREERYHDNVTAKNDRYQLSAFYIF